MSVQDSNEPRLTETVNEGGDEGRNGAKSLWRIISMLSRGGCIAADAHLGRTMVPSEFQSDMHARIKKGGDYQSAEKGRGGQEQRQRQARSGRLTQSDDGSLFLL